METGNHRLRTPGETCELQPHLLVGTERGLLAAVALQRLADDTPRIARTHRFTPSQTRSLPRAQRIDPGRWSISAGSLLVRFVSPR